MTRILIVEDEPLIGIMLKEWLTELGCEPIGPARTVTHALSLIADTSVEAAILDISLNGEDAYRVADELYRRKIPIAFASGSTMSEKTNAYSGAVLLSKPYDFDALRSIVYRLVDLALRE